MLQNQRVFLDAKIRTLEIWNHDFTVRYNLNLQITDTLTGKPVSPSSIQEELLVWTHTRVFKKSQQKVLPLPISRPRAGAGMKPARLSGAFACAAGHDPASSEVMACGRQ